MDKKTHPKAHTQQVPQSLSGAQGAQSRTQSNAHAQTHTHAETHHHHTHAPSSHHAGGHHLLQVENLSVGFEMYETNAPYFRAQKVLNYALRNLNISVHAGEVVAVVGESGSGKSVLIDSILGLNPPNAHVSGNIWFDGTQMSEAALSRARGSEIALVPQGVSSLDPHIKVGKCAGAALFERFGLGEDVKKMYPHELSGGMAKRVLLCCAMAANPRVILADEPTAGIDEVRAACIFDALREVANAGGGVLLITHDITLACDVADRVAVFRAGTIVEETAAAAFASPQLLKSEYARALVAALPENEFEVCARGGEVASRVVAWRGGESAAGAPNSNCEVQNA